MSSAATALSVISVVLLVYLASFGLILADYIITSLSLYTIANRRGIANSWLVWLPIGNSWIIGSIVDRLSAIRGVRSKWKTVLLILSLVGIGSFVFLYVFFIVIAIVTGIQSSMSYYDAEAAALGMLLPMILVYVIVILAIGALGSCQTICLYKIFEELAPEKAIKYLLLSLLVPLAGAICLSKCKNSMYGVPVAPPVAPVAPAPVAPVAPPVAEPMEQPTVPAEETPEE